MRHKTITALLHVLEEEKQAEKWGGYQRSSTQGKTCTGKPSQLLCLSLFLSQYKQGQRVWRCTAVPGTDPTRDTQPAVWKSSLCGPEHSTERDAKRARLSSEQWGKHTQEQNACTMQFLQNVDNKSEWSAWGWSCRRRISAIKPQHTLNSQALHEMLPAILQLRLLLCH